MTTNQFFKSVNTVPSKFLDSGGRSTLHVIWWHNAHNKNGMGHIQCNEQLCHLFHKYSKEHHEEEDSFSTTVLVRMHRSFSHLSAVLSFISCSLFASCMRCFGIFTIDSKAILHFRDVDITCIPTLIHNLSCSARIRLITVYW